MKKVKVSIIVPVYNVEDYIEKSIKSLLDQTLDDIEIIAVDDGSKDKSGGILDALAKKNKRLKVVHKKNEGVSIARNVGLEIAKGEYIGFMDSDDWVSNDMFEKLYNKAISGNYDIVACDTNAVYPDRNVVVKSNILDDQEPSKLMIDAYAVIWNKIYKRDLIDDIKFKEGMNFCEDVLFLYMVYSRVSKVGSLNEALHYYLQRDGSLTYTYDKKLYQLIDSMDNIVDYYIKTNVMSKYNDEIEFTYVRYLYATFIKRLAKTNDVKEFKKGVKYVRNKVNESFPKYRKNRYLRGVKGLYLKFFNMLLAKIIFYKERNRMN